MIQRDTLTTNVYLFILAEVFGLLVWVLQAVLFGGKLRELLLLLLLLYLAVLLRVKVVEDGEIFNELLYVGRKARSTGWTSQNV